MTKKKSTEQAGCCREPPIEPSLPYDEVNHEIQNNRLTVRVAKNVGKIEPASGIEGTIVPSIHASCCNSKGGTCRTGCAKLNIFPNEAPPVKKPDQQQTILRTTRKIVNADEIRNTLEIELRTARNYEPLPPVEPYKFDPEAAAAMLQASSKKKDNEGKKKGKKK